MKASLGEEVARLQAEIRRRIAEFDLLSLWRLLQRLGWRPDEIRLRSHCSTLSQPSLIHDIEFLPEVRQVRVTLNFGLLAAQGYLPSYFFKELDSGTVDVQTFLDFVGFFDDALLRGFFRAINPELDRQLFADWEATKRRALLLLNLRSCVTIHWLFQVVFPELEVAVEKALLGREVRTESLQLGTATLGSDAVFGKRVSVPVQGRRVTLMSEGERTLAGQPWPTEIASRLEELVFPVLGAVGVDLEILLVILTQETWARLHDESYLGYENVQGGKAAYRRIRLYSGYCRGQDPSLVT